MLKFGTALLPSTFLSKKQKTYLFQNLTKGVVQQMLMFCLHRVLETQPDSSD